MAPNLITVWGFSWNLLCLAIVFGLYGNSTDGYFNPWLACFIGVSYFIYTTADNCDGKQARKNGTGSPMGCLFDHGLDATTAIIMNVVLTRILNIGPGLPAILAIQISTVPFYCLTMEEYYIGMLNLPIFTGPDDTSLAISGIAFLSAYLGTGDFWLEHVDVPFGIPEMLGIPPTMRKSSFACYIVYSIEIVAILAGSARKYWKSRNESHFKERFTWNSFAAHAGYMYLNVIVYDVYGILCGSEILHTHTRSIIFCFAGQFLQGCLRMIVANASGENFNPYRRTTLIAWGLMGINILSFIIWNEPIIDEKWLFRGINIMIWSAIAHYVYYVLDEMKVILGINIFTVTPRPPIKESGLQTPMKIRGKMVNPSDRVLRSATKASVMKAMAAVDAGV